MTLVSEDMLVLLPPQEKRNRGPSLPVVAYKYSHKHAELPGICGSRMGTGYLVSRNSSRLALRREFGVNSVGPTHLLIVTATSLLQHTQGT